MEQPKTGRAMIVYQPSRLAWWALGYACGLLVAWFTFNFM